MPWFNRGKWCCEKCGLCYKDRDKAIECEVRHEVDGF